MTRLINSNGMIVVEDGNREEFLTASEFLSSRGYLPNIGITKLDDEAEEDEE